MLKEKRKPSPVMLKVDRQIEQWRSSLLSRVHQRLDTAIYLLVSSTCVFLREEFRRRMPHDASNLHSLTRDKLFALQFALSGLNGELPQGRFIEDLIVDSLTPEDKSRAFETVKIMSEYAYARDVFLTYSWGGYEITDNSTENTLHFVDSPGWEGQRDRARQIISQEIDAEQAQSFIPPRVIPRQLLVEQEMRERLNIPPTLPLGDLTAGQFLSAWHCMLLVCEKHWLASQPLAIEKEALVAILQRKTHLSAYEVERFVNLVTFDAQFIAVCRRSK